MSWADFCPMVFSKNLKPFSLYNKYTTKIIAIAKATFRAEYNNNPCDGINDSAANKTPAKIPSIPQ